MDVYTLFFGGDPVKIENGVPAEEETKDLPEGAFVYPRGDGQRVLQVQKGKLVPVGKIMPPERLL